MRKRYAFIGLSLLLACVLLGIVYSYKNPRLGFGYYEPTFLPPNTAITDKRVVINRGVAMVDQNFRTEDWVYSIHEYKATHDIGNAMQNYDPSSITPTCDIRNSSNGTRYRLCHWIDYGKIDVQEITFVQNSTFIDAKIPSALKSNISETDIDRFVSSFTQQRTRGFQVLRSNGS